MKASLVLIMAVGLSVRPALASAQRPARAPAARTGAAATGHAHLTVTLPRKDATLAVQGMDVTGDTEVREFDTLPLEAGRDYRYLLTTEWRPNNYTIMTRTRTVAVRAGSRIVVDLTADESTDRAKVRYVPTPESVVARMIAMAGVTAGDVVYEPGCGDARITIAAVRAGARKGVGIDLDPDRVEESRANVKAAGLEGKIDIRLGDALDIKDLSDATVVFLYMGEEFNLLIRPILWKQLKVGARVVSHRFTMGDWVPDATDYDNLAEGPSTDVHLWTITDEIKQQVAKP